MQANQFCGIKAGTELEGGVNQSSVQRLEMAPGSSGQQNEDADEDEDEDEDDDEESG